MSAQNPVEAIQLNLKRLSETSESLFINLEQLRQQVFKTGVIPPELRPGIPGRELGPTSQFLRELSKARDNMQRSLNEANNALLVALGLRSPT